MSTQRRIMDKSRTKHRKVSRRKTKDSWNPTTRKWEKRLETGRHGRRVKDKPVESSRDMDGLPKAFELNFREIPGPGFGSSIPKEKVYFSKVGDPTSIEPETIPFSIEEKKDKLKSLEEDRGKIYGDPFLSHQAIGLAWEGIFRNRYHELFMGNSKVGKLFPADLVAEMLAAFKLVRLARPIYLQDSADDAKVYISFSERFRSNK